MKSWEIFLLVSDADVFSFWEIFVKVWLCLIIPAGQIAADKKLECEMTIRAGKIVYDPNGNAANADHGAEGIPGEINCQSSITKF